MAAVLMIMTMAAFLGMLFYGLYIFNRGSL